jgi:hypothetical protein
MTVVVPNVVGLGRAAAEAKLDSFLLRHIARFPFDAAGNGTAVEQMPIAGIEVRRYSVVTVSYPSPLGPMDDSPVEGPTLSGTMEGLIESVVVDGGGASIVFAGQVDFRSTGRSRGESMLGSVSLVLYLDQSVPLLPRAEWMRRGAMLSLAQRACTNHHSVRLVVAYNIVQSIEIFSGPDQFRL